MIGAPVSGELLAWRAHPRFCIPVLCFPVLCIPVSCIPVWPQFLMHPFMPNRSSIFLASLIGLTALASPAAAKYSLCNKTSYTLSAAIAYVESERLATRGWWRLRPGQCKVVLTEPTTPGRYFAYAEAIPGHEGPLRAWSGDTPLCVENSGFFNLRNQEVCKDEPTRQRNFFDVEVTADANGTYQTDFVEQDNYSVYSAEIAGVQRLLRDVGATTGSIDGFLGRQTQRDLSAYRKARNLGDGATIDDKTVDALIEEANAKEAKRGLFFCNKTDEPVWSALALADGETYQSKGWWRIQSGDCAKVVKGALEMDHFFVHGVIENARGEKRLAGGNQAFCVNAVRFDVTNDAECDALELDEALFTRVAIGGKGSATFDFTPDMFVSSPASPEGGPDNTGR